MFPEKLEPRTSPGSLLVLGGLTGLATGAAVSDLFHSAFLVEGADVSHAQGPTSDLRLTHRTPGRGAAVAMRSLLDLDHTGEQQVVRGQRDVAFARHQSSQDPPPRDEALSFSYDVGHGTLDLLEHDVLATAMTSRDTPSQTMQNATANRSPLSDSGSSVSAFPETVPRAAFTHSAPGSPHALTPPNDSSALPAPFHFRTRRSHPCCRHRPRRW